MAAAFPGGLCPLPAQNENPPQPEIDESLPVPEWRRAFDSLSREAKVAYQEKIFEATRLFNQKRIIEALNEVAEAEKIFDQGPASHNLRGACYVEFRAFDRARAVFERALELQGAILQGVEGPLRPARKLSLRPVVNILFNIAEMDFVTGRWQDCHDRIEKILPLTEDENVTMRRLVEFKYLLCKLKLGQVAEARALADKYDYLDDNPYYYYANAAIAYFDKNNDSAERWRTSARKVFRRPQILAPWEDTMIEFGYVKSFYGGDLEEDLE